MNEIKDGAGTWAHEMQTYEMEKRRVLDEGFLRPPAMKLTAGQMKSQERVFDPLLQRYRDHEIEYKQRLAEETERINHLNRAMDIQVVREQPHHILTHESKFDTIAPGQDPTRQPHKQRNPVGKDGSTFPNSQQDYNIISNLAFDVHHWNRPECRPRCVEQSGKQRKIHASKIRDFNIVNNRYPVEHEARTRKEKELEIAEATYKYMKSNRFDPVTQQFNDPTDEEKAKHCDDAREVEVHLRAEDKIPPSYKGRKTNFYDAISNEVYDPGMVKYLQTLEAERKDRYRNRHIVEHNFHTQDVKGDHLREARKLNKVAPERFMEHDRGYDFVTNKKFGNGAKEQIHYGAGYPQKRKTPWEEIEHSHSINGRRSASTPALPSAASAEVQRSEEATPVVADAPAPARSSRSNGGADRDGAASQRSQASKRSQTSQRSQTLSEAGSRAMSHVGSSSAAQLREPPGATRPVPRSATPKIAPVALPRVSSTPNIVPGAMPRSSSTPNFSPATLSPVSELRASAVMTRKLPPPVSIGESRGMTRASPAPDGFTMTRAPPAPAIPGSPVGSVYSRPSAKP